MFPSDALAMNGFYKVPDEKDSRVACFSCGVKYLCYRSGTGCTDEELLDQHEDDCHWADMYRELIAHAIIASPTSASDVAGQRHPETDSSPFPHRSSPLSSPLPAANVVSCEMASDLSSPTSADNLHTRSDNTYMPTSPKHITKSDFRPRYIRPDFGTLRYRVLTLWTSCTFQISVERGRRTNKRSASLRLLRQR
jgi:hypothetical protein